MNKKAVEGYLMARNFMLCYKAENTPKDELALVSQHLDIIVAKYQRGKIPIKKYLNNGWDFFREKVEIIIQANSNIYECFKVFYFNTLNSHNYQSAFKYFCNCEFLPSDFNTSAFSIPFF